MAMSKVMYSSRIALLCGLASLAVLVSAKPLDYGQLFSGASGKEMSPKLLAALSRPLFRHNTNLNNSPKNNYELVGSGAPESSSTYADRLEALYRDLLYGPYAREEPAVESALADRQLATAEMPSIEQLQDLKQLLADYDAVISGNGNSDNDYFQSEQPVVSSAVDVDAPTDDTSYLTEAREGTWLDGPVVPHVEYNTEDPVDQLLLNYFLEHYRNLADSAPEDGTDDAAEDLESVEKRRQKVVLKEEAKVVVSSTARPVHHLTTPSPSTSSARKASKFGPMAKATNTNRRGQKEVAQLRPAEAKPKEWPTELEEKNLEEVSANKQKQANNLSQCSRLVIILSKLPIFPLLCFKL